MPRIFDRPHIDLSGNASTHNYKPPRQNISGGGAPRVREEHGRMLRDQLQAAYREVQEISEELEEAEPADGAYYEISLQPGSKPDKLESKRRRMSIGATKIDPETGEITTVVFIPHESIEVVDQIFEDYAEGELSLTGQPSQKALVEPINDIRRARLLSVWTDDPAALPEQPQDEMWWEVWVAPDAAISVAEILDQMGCRVGSREQWLSFPESAVIPVYGRKADMELGLILTGGIQELRRGSDTPNFFVEDERENQREWVDDLADRIVWPDIDVPRVCLLDTGVNRAHPLIEPALSHEDLLTVDTGWPATDNVRNPPHGTGMAGLSLHGDLFPRLQDQSVVTLTHRLESVRIIPDGDFPPNEPTRYGSITLSGISLAETQNPDFSRIFSLPITNQDRSGERGSSWSACLDRAAAGILVGDEAERPRRLICVSAGNIETMIADELNEPDQFPIEDPAQAWNVLSVGGYTEKTLIDPNEAAFENHTPFSDFGDVSPFSRNSLTWPSGKTPIKPDVVFEAGNRALSPAGTTIINCPSMELLTTGADVDRLPIDNFAATSAATAQAARLGARISGDHPEFWPETIRALIVHSAEWTDRMMARLEDETNNYAGRKQVLRTCGYGVPSYERARSSSLSQLALISQSELQPFIKTKTGVSLHECHYYELPWPRDVLEQYLDQQFTLKLTLSYFVDPNPGKSAAIDPANYRSFGLRFDLKRPRETLTQFKRRINEEEREEGRRATTIPDSGKWVIGPRGINAGSLHCDVWTGTGAQLASRNHLCIKPVSGWWKARRSPEICEQTARYSLILTITSPNEDIDLHTPISNIIKQRIDVEIEDLI